MVWYRRDTPKYQKKLLFEQDNEQIASRKMHVSHMHTHWHLVRLLFTYSDTTLLDPVTLILLVGILHPFRKASSIRVTLDHPDKLSIDNEEQLARKSFPTCVTLLHPEMSSVVSELQLERKRLSITVTLFHPEMLSVVNPVQWWRKQLPMCVTLLHPDKSSEVNIQQLAKK